MNRREFLKSSCLAVCIPSVLAAKELKTRTMTFESFCRDVLKVELSPIDWEIAREISSPKNDCAFNSGEWSFPIDADSMLRRVDACYILWGAHTNPDRYVWLHGNRLQILYFFAYFIGVEGNNPYVEHLLERVGEWHEDCEAGPNDWHYYSRTKTLDIFPKK